MTHNQSSPEDPNERLVDLLIQRSTFGVSNSEQQELDQLAASSDNPLEIERFEVAAAAFDLSFSAVEEMPHILRDRVLISAGEFLKEQQLLELVQDSGPTEPPAVHRKSAVQTLDSINSGFGWRGMASVLVTAASLMLVVSGYNPFARPGVIELTASQQMETFLENSPSDLVMIDWTPVDSPDAGGKVIWSDSAQEGYMVFTGMAINDPSITQYQLWVFDSDPKQEVPTDGGVFDISKLATTGLNQIVVPIKTTVPVGRAVQFAVTEEIPGGVYLSKRALIPVLATLASAN